MYGHDISRTNYNPDETTISAANVNQLGQRWQANIGSNGTGTSGAPSVANGVVYVPSSAASPASNFFAYDAVSGSRYSIEISATGVAASMLALALLLLSPAPWPS